MNSSMSVLNLTRAGVSELTHVLDALELEQLGEDVDARSAGRLFDKFRNTGTTS